MVKYEENKGLVGIYDKESGKILERCSISILEKALDDWGKLGYETYVGVCWVNLIILGQTT